MSSIQDSFPNQMAFQRILYRNHGGICCLTAFSREYFSNLVALQKDGLFGMTGVFVRIEDTGDDALVVLISAFQRRPLARTAGSLGRREHVSLDLSRDDTYSMERVSPKPTFNRQVYIK